jgi:LysR family hydrogen peroxide-inducible transcriptional activator
MNLPTTKQLRYFVALAEHGHFGRAAAASFVSQSAFSTAIQDLENILQVQLVDRTNRQVTITALGQQIAVQARLCLNDLESLVEIAQGESAPLTGELRLGVIPTIAPFLLPKALPRLRKAYPKLRLLLTEDQTARLHERLLDGRIDVMLLALPYDLRGADTLSPRVIASRGSTPAACCCWRTGTACAITRWTPASCAMRASSTPSPQAAC